MDNEQIVDQSLDDVVGQFADNARRASAEQPGAADALAAELGFEIEADTSDSAADPVDAESQALPSTGGDLDPRIAGGFEQLGRTLQGLNEKVERLAAPAQQQLPPNLIALQASLEEKWASMPAEEADKEKMSLMRALIMESQKNAEATYQQQQQASRQQEDQQGYEEMLQFVASGGRVDPHTKAITQNASAKLTDAEITFARQYVVPNGWTLQEWADEQIKRRGTARSNARAVAQTVSSATAAPSETGSRTNTPPEEKPTTLDQVVFLTREGLEKKIRRANAR